MRLYAPVRRVVKEKKQKIRSEIPEAGPLLGGRDALQPLARAGTLVGTQSLPVESSETGEAWLAFSKDGGAWQTWFTPSP